jgi:hypothetical protein
MNNNPAPSKEPLPQSYEAADRLHTICVNSPTRTPVRMKNRGADVWFVEYADRVTGRWIEIR